MAWEQRGPSDKCYLYLTRRDEAGKVLKQYIGCGAEAQATAEDLAGRHARREADRRAVRDSLTRLAAVDGLMVELDAAATALMEAA